MAAVDLSVIAQWIDEGELTLSQAVMTYHLGNDEKRTLRDLLHDRKEYRQYQADQLKAELLADIKARPAHYYAEKVAALLSGDTDTQFEAEDIAQRFLLSGGILDFEELASALSLPPSLTETMVCAGDYPLADFSIREYSDPILPPRCTDVYVLGSAGVGKSSLICSLIRRLVDDFGAVPEYSTWSDKQREYFESVMACTKDFSKFPTSSSSDTLLTCQLHIKDSRRHLNIIDSGRRGLADLSKVLKTDTQHTPWLHRLLKNDNDKILIFLMDYHMLVDQNVRTMFNQISSLEAAFLALICDGQGENGRKGCTMSRVRAMALVFTQYDDAAVDVAEARMHVDEFVNNYLLNLQADMSDVFPACRVNADNDHKLYTLLHSLGKVAIGSTLLYNPSDSRELASLVVSNCSRRNIFGF